jgi:hypothetical protein
VKTKLIITTIALIILSGCNYNTNKTSIKKYDKEDIKFKIRKYYQLQQGQPPISIKIDSLVPAPKYLLLEEQIKRLKKIDATYGSAYVEKIESIYENVDRKTLGYRCYVQMEEMYEGEKMKFKWVYILDENFNVLSD